MKNNKINLLKGPVAWTILKMAGGMLFGFAAMSAFNAIDTYFVGQLGSAELAAMSFTFPIVMLLNSISMGLGIGISSVVSRAIGSRDHNKVQRLTTDGLVLAVLVVLVASVCGIITIRPLFRLLGASGQTLNLIQDYMFIWYIGLPFVVIPMAGNNAIRATGDTLTPSVIMIAAVVINVVLDPLLIFGTGPFPHMGIAGAALATVIARFSTLLFSLGILAFREKLLSFERPGPAEVLSSWKQIAFIGVPAALVQIINPLSLGVITRLLAQFGENVVAGFGVAGKIEMLVLIIPMALASVMAPFAGQNWGAKNIRRIIRAFRFSSLSCVIWGVFLFLGFTFLAEPVLGLFSSDAGIVQAGSMYVRIVSISYGFSGVLFIASQSFSAMNRPLESAGITLLKAFIINIPLAFLGACFLHETGIFTASLLTNLSGGIAGFFILFNFLKRNTKSQTT